eukprot:NODE_4042_length_613_cov_608.406028_g2905_i0.p3 GENE.NODE_4042_length_613_cov_608.406028_g2905_i0~~NODE_4042_length_613_cov_608.406028_g2905_i0.p3  ORF type:complete len:81 (-),score=21.73 NODE_4042_length_613_cov_608.406028_g2905_i0:295-537(-)
MDSFLTGTNAVTDAATEVRNNLNLNADVCGAYYETCQVICPKYGYKDCDTRCTKAQHDCSYLVQAMEDDWAATTPGFWSS